MITNEILADGNELILKDVLKMDGQVLEILPPLPSGYEYRVQKVIPAAVNSKTVLLIAKKEDK